MSTPRRLVDMLEDYCRLVHGEAWTSPEFIQHLKNAGYRSATAEGILLTMLDTLPEVARIGSIDDLQQVLDEHYRISPIDMAMMTLTDEQRLLEERNFLHLVEPAVYDFELPIFASFTRWDGDAVPEDLEIGGRYALELVYRRLEEVREPLAPGWQSVGPDSFSYATFLAGKVEAVHWTGVIRKALALCEEMTGTHLALKLADRSPARTHGRTGSGAVEPWLSAKLSRHGGAFAKNVELSWRLAAAVRETQSDCPEKPSMELERILYSKLRVNGAIAETLEKEIADAKKRRAEAISPFVLGGDNAARHQPVKQHPNNQWC